MASLHIIIIPLMAQGHLLPAADIAKLFADRGAIVTIITTPLNANRIHSLIKGSPRIRILNKLHIPLAKFGLPEGCENMEKIPSRELYKNFFLALNELQEPLEKVIPELKPSPSCVIADKNLPWVAGVCEKFRMKRFSFDGTSCFSFLCSHNIRVSKVLESGGYSELDWVLVPGLRDRIEFTAAQLPADLNPGSYLKELHEKGRIAHDEAYGLVVNSFEELEFEYLKECRKLRGGRIWCIGPVSLSNKTDLEKAQRGGEATVDVDMCMNWLDTWPKNSVVYVCLGSLGRLPARQRMELGLALQESSHPFIWVVKDDDRQETAEMSSVVGIGESDGMRTKGRGLLMKGWAPQLQILSHSSVGAFLTHCGWNSVLEGVSAGVPLITWPLFADQFYNEKEVVQVLKIGESVGNKKPIPLGDEEKSEVSIAREEIRKVIDEVMGEGKEAEERRQRARRLGEKAEKATEDGGSSFLNVTRLLEHIRQLVLKNEAASFS